MEHVGAYEAKTHLSRLLDRVAKGEWITITKHGHPVAVLKPVVESDHASVASVAAELRDFRKGRLLEGSSIREMIEEGRR